MSVRLLWLKEPRNFVGARSLNALVNCHSSLVGRFRMTMAKSRSNSTQEASRTEKEATTTTISILVAPHPLLLNHPARMMILTLSEKTLQLRPLPQHPRRCVDVEYGLTWRAHSCAQSFPLSILSLWNTNIDKNHWCVLCFFFVFVFPC